MSQLSLQRRILARQCICNQVKRYARPRNNRFAQQRQPVNVTAFKTQDETISISLDGYNLLQVNRAASRETCSKKYDEMVNSPPNSGYSQETLYSRAVVLKCATEAVIELTATPSYRQQPGQLSVELLYSDLPGALALLQEAGELQTVLDWGGAWLRDSATHSKTKDVALALALAHCDSAAMKLEHNADDSLAAAEEMSAALRLLRQYAAGEQLQEDITDALQELEPKAVLQQIALPMDADKRAAGIAILSQLVWTADKSRLGMPRADYMRSVRNQLTAAEQIQLYEAAGEGITVSSEDQYDTALAYLAEGYCSRRPQHVRTAHKLLAAVKKQSDLGSNSTDADVTVELAVCCLLLGDSEKAEDILGLGPDSPPENADPAIRSFVMDACPNPDDLLPGLCALAQRWLADVALPGFRDAPSQAGSLADWFDDRRVALYLQVLDNGRRLHLADAADATKQAFSGVAKGISSAFMLPFQTLQNALKLAPPALPDSAERQPVRIERQPKSTSMEAGPLSAGATVTISVRTSENGSHEASPIEGRIAEALVAGTELATKQQPNPASNDLLDEDMSPLKRAVLVKAGRNQQSLTGSLPITDGIVQFAGEREMWASFQDATLRKRRRLKMLAGGAVMLAAAFAVRAFQQHKAGVPTAPSSNPLHAVSQAFHQGTETLTEASAKQLLLQWQDVKADALGASHASSKLSLVLDAELLSSWQTQAATVQTESKHWEYDLKNLDILSVDTSDDGTSAVILAAIQEDASLFEDSALLHVYKGTYTAEYEAVHSRQGWKLISSTITI
ncbi:hypothetical protein WJX77_009734 [Trebouxia sp. C0004]